MKLNDLIIRAAVAYPEAAVLENWNTEKGSPRQDKGNDTLALFVVRELYGTFDPEADEGTQIATAVSAMQTAADELQSVASAFSEMAVRRAA